MEAESIQRILVSFISIFAVRKHPTVDITDLARFCAVKCSNRAVTRFGRKLFETKGAPAVIRVRARNSTGFGILVAIECHSD